MRVVDQLLSLGLAFMGMESARFDSLQEIVS